MASNKIPMNFITWLLSELHALSHQETPKYISIISQTTSSWREEWQNFCVENPSHVTSIMTLQTTTRWKCDCTYQRTTHHDHFRRLSIQPGEDMEAIQNPIPSNSSDPCPHCGCLVRRKVSVSHAPVELLIIVPQQEAVDMERTRQSKHVLTRSIWETNPIS